VLLQNSALKYRRSGIKFWNDVMYNKDCRNAWYDLNDKYKNVIVNWGDKNYTNLKTLEEDYLKKGRLPSRKIPEEKNMWKWVSRNKREIGPVYKKGDKYVGTNKFRMAWIKVLVNYPLVIPPKEREPRFSNEQYKTLISNTSITNNVRIFIDVYR
jgi:hypothetical protein